MLLTNQGSISTPNADNANADLVWPAGPSGLGYSYEFGPLVAAEVVNADGDTLHIVDDGFLLQQDLLLSFQKYQFHLLSQICI